MALNPAQTRLSRGSLVAVWLWTALVSAWPARALGVQLLQANTHIPTTLYPWLIWSGIALDLLLGLLMLLRPRPGVYMAALLATVVMTLLGTWVDPALWLHPLGPLSKNLPILALLWILASPRT